MDQRITIQESSESRDSTGAAILSWSDVATVWAKVRKPRGDEKFGSQHIYSEATHEIELRYRSGITTRNRIIWGTHTLDIVFVDDTLKRKGKLMLVCKEVV